MKIGTYKKKTLKIDPQVLKISLTKGVRGIFKSTSPEAPVPGKKFKGAKNF
jgi:hypothetical protein